MVNNTLPGDTLVLFRIEDKIFGLPLGQVSRVERAVKVTTIPDSPPGLLGVIDNHGNILPVINMRYKTNLPQRPIDINDQMIIVNCHYFMIVVPVDKVEGIYKAQNVVTPKRLLGREINLPQFMVTDLGIVMVISFEQILTFNETLEMQDMIENLPIGQNEILAGSKD